MAIQPPGQINADLHPEPIPDVVNLIGAVNETIARLTESLEVLEKGRFTLGPEAALLTKQIIALGKVAETLASTITCKP